jgi:hypothetical protein
MQQFVLCLTRDMQSEFTFAERVNTRTNAVIVKQLNLVGHYEHSFGSSTVVACEILNYKEDQDIDDMILQHPYIKEWTLKYSKDYIFTIVK